MRVIHGIWAHGALRVWGEDPELPPAPRDPAPAPAPHPFACPAAELADLLAALPGPAMEAGFYLAAARRFLFEPRSGLADRSLAGEDAFRLLSTVRHDLQQADTTLGCEQRLALAGCSAALKTTSLSPPQTLIRRTEFVMGKQHETSPTGGRRPSQPSNPGKTARLGSGPVRLGFGNCSTALPRKSRCPAGQPSGRPAFSAPAAGASSPARHLTAA